MLRASHAPNFNPVTILSSKIVEWWTTLDLSSMSVNTSGAVKVAADGDLVAYWRGQYQGTVVTASADAASDPYKVNRLGTRGAVAFAGTSHGLVGNLACTFLSGATIIMLGRMTGAGAAFRAAACLGPDTATNPGTSPNGLVLGVGTAGGNLTCSSNNINTADWPFVTNTPYMLAATIRQTVTGSVNIPGFTTNKVIQKLWANGGRQPMTFTFNSNTSNLAVGAVSIGGRPDSRFGAVVDICDLIVTHSELDPLELQAITDNWVTAAGLYTGVI